MDVPNTRATLLERLAGDDDASAGAAWFEFERTYRELVVRYCRHRGLQRADSEEVWQAVLVALYAALPAFQYDPRRGRFRSYLFAAVGRAIERLRRDRRRSHELVWTSCGTESRWTDAAFEREWVEHHYRLALQRLADRFDDRNLRVFEDLLRGDAVSAIALRHRVSEQAVHKAKQRVRDRLRDLICEQIQREDELPSWLAI